MKSLDSQIPRFPGFHPSLPVNGMTHDVGKIQPRQKNHNFVQMTSVWRKADEKEFEAGWAADVRVTASKSI